VPSHRSCLEFLLTGSLLGEVQSRLEQIQKRVENVLATLEAGGQELVEVPNFLVEVQEALQSWSQRLNPHIPVINYNTQIATKEFFYGKVDTSNDTNLAHANYCLAAQKLQGHKDVGYSSICTVKNAGATYACFYCHLNIWNPGLLSYGMRNVDVKVINLLARSHLLACRSAADCNAYYRCYHCYEYGLKEEIYNSASSYIGHIESCHKDWWDKLSDTQSGPMIKPRVLEPVQTIYEPLTTM